MKKVLKVLCLSLCLMLGLAGCSSNTTTSSTGEKTAAVELNISAAASLQEAMIEIEKEFKNVNPDVKLTVNLGASGALMQQIQEGAPCDVFISAGNKQMEQLITDGIVAEDAATTLLTNDLVLITEKGEPVESLEALKEDGIDKIAIGDPESVPAGKYAKEVLDNTKLYSDLESKLVLAKDVKEVLSWVQQGSAQVGFVYLSDAIGNDKVDIALTTEEDTHSPIAYPIAVIKETKNQEAAQQFQDFLLSEDGQNILEKYGFKKVK